METCTTIRGSIRHALPPMSNDAQSRHLPECVPGEHPERARAAIPDRAFTGAVSLFKALADEQRLRTLAFLSEGEACGSEIAAVFDEPLSTVSHRMKLLEGAGGPKTTERLPDGESVPVPDLEAPSKRK